MLLVQDGLHFILRFTIDDDGRWEVMRMSRRVEGTGVGVRKKLTHMVDIMNLHVRREFKGTSGGGGSLDDLEGADEPGLERGGWVHVLEVEVMGREANRVTNRVCRMTMMHVGVVPMTVLRMGDGVRSHLDGVTNEFQGRCSR